jgi:glycosyltransferase involved in cell wall biosynthesis
VTEVLYISYDGMTDPLGQSQVIPYLTGLSKENFHFTLLSAEKPIAFEKQKNEIGELLRKNNIDWQPIIYTKRPPVLSTLIDIWKMQRKAYSLNKKKKFAIVHCRSYISSLIGLKLKKKSDVKFIFDMRGLWADERVDGGLWNLKDPFYNFIYKFFKRKEIEFLKNADQTISLTENGKKEILSWPVFKNDPIPISVIPCCVDSALFDPEGIPAELKTRLKTKLNISESTFVLSYVGTAGPWYKLNEMLDFFLALKEIISNSVFLFIVNGDTYLLKNLMQAKAISPSSTVITHVNRSEVPLYISISNATVFFIKTAYSKVSTSPTKLAEVVSMRIPVIANSGIGDLQSVFEENKIGYLVNSFSQKEYKTAVNKIIEMSGGIKQGESARMLLTYNINAGVKNYLEIYNRLTDCEK